MKDNTNKNSIKEDYNQLNENKEINNLNDAPTLQINNLFYNCTECPSTIKIISINEKENIIKFKCNNNHNKEMKIKEYLEKMKKYNDIKLNDKMCNIHNKEFICYCCKCNTHLCKECIKLRKHNVHYKIYMNEIIPENHILDDMRDLIKGNEIKIKDLKDEKINKIKKLEKILNKNINKIKELKDIKENNNKIKENEEIKKNNNNYKSKIKQ